MTKGPRAVAALCIVGLVRFAQLPAGAADVIWRAPSSGYFDDGTKWGIGRAPTSSDGALFRLDAAESYTVTFRANATNQRLLIPNDTLEFVIGTTSPLTYTLLPTIQPLPVSMTVGTFVSSLAANTGDLLLSYGTIKAVDAVVGRDADSLGMVTVDGPSSAWRCTGTMIVGNNGDGSVYVQNGASVSAGATIIGNSNYGAGEIMVGADGGASSLQTGSTTLGQGSETSGAVSLFSGSTWNAVSGGAPALLVVGGGGEGIISLDAGSSLSSGLATVGQSVDSSGVVLMDGARWTVHGALTVGLSGDGLVELREGGHLASSSGIIGGVMVGQSVGGSGAVTLEGAGSAWEVSEKVFVGGDASGARGEGIIRVLAGASLKTGQGITVWTNGVLRVEDPELAEAGPIRLEGGLLSGWGIVGSRVLASLSEAEIEVDAERTLTLGGELGIAAGGMLNKTGGGSLAIEGQQNHGADTVLNVVEGSVAMSSDAGSSSARRLSVLVNPETEIEFRGSQHLASLALTGGKAMAARGGTRTIDTGTFSMDAVSSFDLADNRLIVRNGSLESVTSWIAAGRAGGTWTGSGIFSSVAAEDATGRTGLAVLLNRRDDGSALLREYGGEAVDANCVLVGWTLNGDSDLDGAIDSDDYFRIDQGYLRQLKGYQNGDFNYDGVVDGGDYILIDAAYYATVREGMWTAGRLNAVPEPQWLGAALMTMLIARRRR